MADLPHLDDLAGSIARLAQILRPRVHNTLDRTSAYEGLGAATLFPAPSEAPALRTRRRWQLPGLSSEELTFRSLHEPIEPLFRRHYLARRRRIHTATARRLRPSGSHDRPRLLYVHGYMQPETVIEEFALLAPIARALDMEVIQLQPPYHGSRKPRRSRLDGELFWTADVVRSIESLRQTVLDARSLLAALQAESPRPVGIAGLSLGGAVAAILTCVEPDFAFSAPFIAHMDIGALMADAPVLGAVRSDLRRFGWSEQDFADFTDRIGWQELLPVLPPERIHLFACEDDHFFRPSVVREMWKRWDEPRIQWYPGSHMGFVAHLPDALRRLRAFADGL